MRRLLFVLPIAAAAHVAAAQRTTAEREILAARDTVWRAWLTDDTARLNRVIPVAAAASNGTDRVSWDDRAKIFSGAREFVSSGARLVSVDFANTHIERSGNVAFVTSDFRLIIAHGARTDTALGRASEVFVRDAGRWVNPYWHLQYADAAATRDRE